ncbi:helix-turn-helix domain-containing protein [Oleiharenicola lentus]|uniref:cupin domain-containing protein n=1 Tax=Oleiharenicola lentus TaxID=2508720 RepID=UPI003F66D5D5
MLEDLKLGPRYDGMLFLAESARNPPRIKSHRHVELELNVVLRGAITYVVDGRSFRFEKRSLLWLFPGQEHQLVDRTVGQQNYVAVFKQSLIKRACSGEAYAFLSNDGVGLEGVLHTRLDPETFDLVCKTMDSVMVGAQDADVLNREAGFGQSPGFRFEHADPDGLNAGLHHLLLLCWRAQRVGHAMQRADALHPAVRKALELVSESTNEHALPQLAKLCGASETHLSRLFAQQLGVPLNRYRNSVRLRRFLEFYHGADQRTMAEAAYAAGFGSYAQFHRVFTQAYGSGPRDSL